jgi:hypothetical protein
LPNTLGHVFDERGSLLRVRRPTIGTVGHLSFSGRFIAELE